jgi:membrane protein implicated in regulation of membrane protease activity
VSASRTVVARYTLFQLPELLLVVIALTALVGLGVVSRDVAWLRGGLWVVKEIVLFPFVRRAYEPSDPSATTSLVGANAIVTERLDPTGRVRIGPETWVAKLPVASEPVEVGATVGVKSVEGLTLHVVRHPN